MLCLLNNVAFYIFLLNALHSLKLNGHCSRKGYTTPGSKIFQIKNLLLVFWEGLKGRPLKLKIQYRSRVRVHFRLY